MLPTVFLFRKHPSAPILHSCLTGTSFHFSSSIFGRSCGAHVRHFQLFLSPPPSSRSPTHWDWNWHGFRHKTRVQLEARIQPHFRHVLQTRHLHSSRAHANATPSNPSPDRKERDEPDSAKSGSATIHENIYTLPNLLTVSRILSCPVLGWAIVADRFHLATALLVYAGLTDLVCTFFSLSLKYETSSSISFSFSLLCVPDFSCFVSDAFANFVFMLSRNKCGLACCSAICNVKRSMGTSHDDSRCNLSLEQF